MLSFAQQANKLEIIVSVYTKTEYTDLQVNLQDNWIEVFFFLNAVKCIDYTKRRMQGRAYIALNVINAYI